MIIGAVVYIDLGIGGVEFAEHTAVYVGNNRFVELHGSGEIRIIDSWTLLNSSKQRVGDRIFIATDGFGFPLQNSRIALRALKEVGNKWNYHLLENNCHEFVAGCIINQFENEYNYFYMLNDLISKELNNSAPVKWRAFNPKKEDLGTELWTDNFFSRFILFLKLINVKKENSIQEVFKISGLSDVLKKANNNQKEFLKIYRDLLKSEWQNRKTDGYL